MIYPIKNGFCHHFTTLPADKSIFQRAVLFSLLANKSSKIKANLSSADCKAALDFARHFARVRQDTDFYEISPHFALINEHIFKVPLSFDCANSATLMRLSCGLLAPIFGTFTLKGDASLSSRPMQKLINPLVKMGSNIKLSSSKAPILIKGGLLKGIDYESKISSAQIKSAFILAALRANSQSSYLEPSLSRNHSEQMLQSMGADIKTQGNKLTITPTKTPLNPLNISVPADPSAAFYLVLAALIIPNSKILIKSVLYNQTRLEGFLALKRMGAKLELVPITKDLCDIYASSSQLKAIDIDTNIAWLIDELPALAIAFAFARGKSSLRGAAQLRVKESDRIKAMVYNLKLCGIEACELEDGFEIKGSKPRFAKIKSFKDHRIAMSFMILGLVCGVEIDDEDCIASSFANFKELLAKAGAYFGD